jgi:HAD superfamily hydrolase (TIGR01509 family)
MINAVLWDNDGVLVDTEELYFRSTQEMLSRMGVKLTRDLFIEISLKEGRSAFDLAVKKGIDRETIEQLHEERNRHYSDLLRDGIRVIDGVEDTLSQLRGKISMGVVSNSRKEHFDIIHATSGLLPYFDFVLTREDFINSKPDPEPYLRAIELSGLERENCLIVEDSERGLAAAKAAGIRCLVVPNMLTQDGNFSGAYKVLGSIREVVEIVSRLLDTE